MNGKRKTEFLFTACIRLLSVPSVVEFTPGDRSRVQVKIGDRTQSSVGAPTCTPNWSSLPESYAIVTTCVAGVSHRNIHLLSSIHMRIKTISSQNVHITLFFPLAYFSLLFNGISDL